MSTHARPLGLLGLLVGVVPLVLASCGGGSGGNSNGIASLNNSSGKGETSTTLSKADSEKALLSWVQCMRRQGTNIPDPTVDANGNLTLRPRGGAGGGNTTPTTTAGGNGAQFDRTALQKAQKTCGSPPQSAFGGFNRANSQEFQDAALKFAQCMRKNGVNVPDPDFSTPPSSGAQNGGGTGGPGGGGGGLFGSIDRNDPKTQKALQACQSVLGNAPGGGPGGGGAPPAGGANG